MSNSIYEIIIGGYTSTGQSGGGGGMGGGGGYNRRF